jgi:sulfur-carrier protein adenylyltransferase/sulfurtransferase
MSRDLTQQELVRYDRHLKLPSFGMEGQLALKRSSVLLIGAGGLGSPLALYLAAAGVGRIGIVDADNIDRTNLQRQVLHADRSVGESKVESARSRLLELNPDIEVITHPVMLAVDNATQIISGYDVVADGSDNFPTRYLVNDACVFLKKPNVYGSVFRFEGQASVFDAQRGPCYRCIFSAPPPPGSVPSCEEGGVLGVLPGTIGMIQATEVIKLITGLGEPLIGRLLLYDALSVRFHEIRIRKNKECAVCGERPTITQLRQEEWNCEMPQNETITPKALAERLGSDNAPRVVDVREQYEWDAGHIDVAQLIPLQTVAQRFNELDPNEEVVVYCRSGGRSARAAAFLRDKGFRHVMNLEGGIMRWTSEVGNERIARRE